MRRRTFIVTGMAGALSSLPMFVRAAPPSALDTPLAGSIYYTKDKPGRWADLADSHAPQVESDDGLIMVTTLHEMTMQHHIIKHTLFDGNMSLLGETLFDPQTKSAAVSQYQIKDYKGVAYVVSMCNLHDCWVTRFMI